MNFYRGCWKKKKKQLNSIPNLKTPKFSVGNPSDDINMSQYLGNKI